MAAPAEFVAGLAVGRKAGEAVEREIAQARRGSLPGRGLPSWGDLHRMRRLMATLRDMRTRYGDKVPPAEVCGWLAGQALAMPDYDDTVAQLALASVRHPKREHRRLAEELLDRLLVAARCVHEIALHAAGLAPMDQPAEVEQRLAHGYRPHRAGFGWGALRAAMAPAGAEPRDPWAILAQLDGTDDATPPPAEPPA